MPLSYEVVAPHSHRAFLLGSVHLDRPDAAPLHPLVLEAYERAPLLVLEVDLSSVSEAQLGDLMLGLGRLPPGELLRDRVSPETWRSLEAHCAEKDLPLAELEGLEPWLAALQLLGQSLVAGGLEAERGVERQLLLTSRGKEIRGLETAQEQFALFDSLSDSLQELMLRDALRPTGPASGEAGALLDAWRHGDAAALEALLFTGLEERPELAPFYEATYFARNVRMAQGIEAVLAEAPYAFVVLGAGHLVGDRGVPALLRASGYAVQPATAFPSDLTR
ncbi:MAG: TraB/GumN family protein [Myxococcota bacterium]